MQRAGDVGRGDLVRFATVEQDELLAPIEHLFDREDIDFQRNHRRVQGSGFRVQEDTIRTRTPPIDH
jgi:hypothetical protein